MSTFAGPNTITNGLIFDVDFANTKSINTATSGLTDISLSKFPVTIQNTSSSSIALINGYAEFNPATSTSTASYYAIADVNSTFQNARNEVTLETAIYHYQFFGGSANYNRIVSPRYTESGSPLGWGCYTNTITAEVNTTTGWLVYGYTSPLIQTSSWMVITQTVSVTGNTFKTYVNGLIVGSSTLSSASINTFNGVLIGRGYFGGAWNSNGRVGHVKVYNRALSAEEVLINFNATRSRYGL
jgi:hypothetical protein